MRARWKPAHVVEMVLLLTGIVCLGIFLWDQAATRIEQRQADAELEKQIIRESRERDQSREELRQEPAAEPQIAPTEPRPPSAGPKRGATVGRVEIPRLKIAAVVRSGVDSRTLKRAVGHVPSTALPGQPGNVGLAAHRDTFFRNLKGVRKGDVIRIVTPKGEFEYRVESTRIVMPKNVEVLDPTKENALTLVTCYPFNYVGSAPKRFIVRARQTTTELAAAGGL